MIIYMIIYLIKFTIKMLRKYLIIIDVVMQINYLLVLFLDQFSFNLHQFSFDIKERMGNIFNG